MLFTVILFFKGTTEKTIEVKVPDGKVLVGYKVHDLVNMASVETTAYDKDGNTVGRRTVSMHSSTMTY